MKKTVLRKVTLLSIAFVMMVGLMIGLNACSREYTDFTVTYDNRHMIGYTGELGEELEIPATFKKDGVWYRVTAIDTSAFNDCMLLKSVSVPDGITSIGSSAFKGCSLLTNITLSEGVIGIGSYAFEDCMSLNSLTIPASVTIIGVGAFNQCTSLTTIYYGGMLDEWDHINIGDNNVPLNTATIYYYSENHPTDITNKYWRYVDGVPTVWKHTEVIEAAVAPTCTEPGLTEGKHCAVCNEVLKVQTEVPALGHSYSVTVTPPTATEDGNTTYTCVNCGDSYSENIIPTDFEVTHVNRSMVGYKRESGERLVIPTVFQSEGVWYRVTSIGEQAFYCCSELSSVTIPDSVTSIGDQAFSFCIGLTSITLPASVTSIGYRAFMGCDKLVEVYNLSNSFTVTKGASDNGYVGYSALCVHTAIEEQSCLFVDENGCLFYGGDKGYYLLGYQGNNTELTLPENCCGYPYEIYKYAFHDCDNLTSITIPIGVMSIGDYAFYYCRSLTSITIPDGVTSIGDYAFSNCSNLSSITLPHGLTSIGQGVFSHCSGLTSITIPDRVTSIGVNAFSSCYSLTSIILPNGLMSIGYSAFFGCYSLTSITIPESVTSIGYNAFTACERLTSVIFEKTSGWWYATSSSATSGGSFYGSLANPSTAAKYLTSTYCDYYWKRS